MGIERELFRTRRIVEMAEMMDGERMETVGSGWGVGDEEEDDGEI